MNEKQLIATLQACYFGDKGAFNKILKEYKKLQEENQQLKEENKKYKGAIQTYEILLKSNAEENKQLKDRINKAIEFKEKNGEKQYNQHDNYRGKWYSPDELQTIDKILKGE